MKHCSAFWNHTNLRSGNRIYPCCRFKEPVQTFDGDVEKILFSPQYEKLRNSDVSTLSSCEKCMHEERNGKESLREQFNKQYTTDSVELKYFEVGFDNICDLACDGCWSDWSHTWTLKENPQLTAKQAIVSTNELHNIPSTINKVLFLGGEPLITNRHRRFLENFKSLDTLEVIYNTNGMHLLQDQDLVLLSKCKTVKFIISIDGFNKLNEKVRSGSNWETVEKTLTQIKNLFNVTIHTTIHKNNWHGLSDLYTWIKLNNYDWTTNILTYPKHLDIIHLSDSNKTLFREMLDNLNIPNSNYIKEHINGC
jgi:uncharacterized radical SAM superfamily Fe-S cluster-containing enzyme